MGWLGPMTDRQFQVWQRWLDEEWNRPSRSDYYLMRLLQAFDKDGDKKPLESYRLPFDRLTPEQREARKKQELVHANTESKSQWHGLIHKARKQQIETPKPEEKKLPPVRRNKRK